MTCTKFLVMSKSELNGNSDRNHAKVDALGAQEAGRKYFLRITANKSSKN